MKYAVAVALMLTSCGGDDRGIRASDYDGTCNVAGDCTVIQVGSCSEACGSPTTYASINSKDAARAQQDLKALDCPAGTATCNPGEPPTGVSCTNDQCGLTY